jgi:hypothetical protein
MSALNFALRYARDGLRVLPLWPALPFGPGNFTCGCGRRSRCTQPGKHPLSPLAPHGSKDATLDDKVIADWFTAWPNANLGIATGDGLVVLDIDPRHGGDRALAELEAEHGKLPPTWRVTTGGGGTHIYFYAPAGTSIKNSAGKLGSGIDVRAQGGFVVAPPSLHISGGTYFWEHEEVLASMPSWLVATLTEPKSSALKTPVETWRAMTRDGVREGRRNDAAARLSGYLLRHYVDPVVVLELIQSWNIAKCSPPLEAGEIAAVVESVCGRELERRKAAAA